MTARLDFRPVFFVIGLALCALAGFMTIPAAIDAFADHTNWQAFILSAIITLFVGAAFSFSCQTGRIYLDTRQSFLVASLGVAILAGFAALPFILSDLALSPTDAVFEAMSGITTTGSTVIRELDLQPRGILAWRSLLQWLGGIAIIVLAITLLPSLRIGGMEIFRIEGQMPGMGRISPHIARMMATIFQVYGGMTILLAFGFWHAGMSGFDAWNHAMSTISTGGFSTSDRSLAAYDSILIDMIAIMGMVVGGMPFLLLYQLARGEKTRILSDDQMRWYMVLLIMATLGLAAWLMISQNLSPSQALRHGALTAVSMMTGTGLFTVDFGSWVGLPVAILFFLTFIGGCAGSTSAGIKVFRFHILFSAAKVQVLRLLRPHGIFLPYYNKKPIADDISDSVMGFLLVYVLCFAVLAMALSALGLDFLSALSGAASAVSNAGPGLGPVIGPMASYADLPDAAKWLLSFGMLMGRLELFIVLVLFVPRFWRG